MVLLAAPLDFLQKYQIDWLVWSIPKSALYFYFFDNFLSRPSNIISERLRLSIISIRTIFRFVKIKLYIYFMVFSVLTESILKSKKYELK